MRPLTPRQARQAARLTVIEVSAKIRCSRSAWYNAENEERWPLHEALRVKALSVLRCYERKGRVYRKATL